MNELPSRLGDVTSYIGRVKQTVQTRKRHLPQYFNPKFLLSHPFILLAQLHTMERLSINDHPISGPRHNHPGGVGARVLGPMAPQGPPQLPPQMFTTAAQLLDLTDSKGDSYSILASLVLTSVQKN